MAQLQTLSAEDIQAAVIPLLQNSPLLTGGTSPLFTGTILDDDPTAPNGDGDVQIALHLLAEGDQDATPGPAGSGTRRYVCYFALIIYVGENKRSSATKSRLGRLTRAAREALMQDAVRIDQAPSPQQRWYLNQFKGDGPATLYQRGSGFRRSITFVNFFSRSGTRVAPAAIPNAPPTP